jgi:hypothetical protein
MDADLNSLLNGASNSTSLPSISLPEGLTTLITVFTITASIASVVIVILYFINALTTYRAHRASIEMRDILREMNERDKARSKPAEAQPAPRPVVESELTVKN